MVLIMVLQLRLLRQQQVLLLLGLGIISLVLEMVLVERFSLMVLLSKQEPYNPLVWQHLTLSLSGQETVVDPIGM
uniref:Uncharacterized protein n=1 Tax=uncultured marine virus TaxID=186617 RepID=A0A0F7L1H7_9VIRU|nr:hypothetical protein [uncultured marine virus]